MTDERHPSTLVEVLQGLGNGLTSLSRSPAFAALVEAEMSYRAHMERDDHPVGLHVKDDALIYVEGFQEPIDLVRLRRTIGNAAKSLTKYTGWTMGNLPGLHPSAARNYLVRTNNSLNVLAGLLKSDEVSSPFWDAAEESARKLRSMTSELDDDNLKLAEVYKRIKKLAEECVGGSETALAADSVRHKLTEIMYYISGTEQHG